MALRELISTAWLLNSMKASIAKPHLFLPMAKDVWDLIRDTYSDLENSSQIFELKPKLWRSKQVDHEVTVYYNEMVTLWQDKNNATTTSGKVQLIVRDS